MRLTLRHLRPWAALLLGGALAAGAQTSSDDGAAMPPAMVDRGYFNQELYVPKGQVIHNATCVFCSAQVDGEVTGRVLVLFGNLSVNGEVRGRVTVVGGNAVLDGQARVRRLMLVLFGNLVYESEEALSGSAYVLGGHTSGYMARQSVRRRLAIGPRLISTVALLGFLLALLTAYGVRQRRQLV